MNQSARLPYPGLRAYTHEETDLFFGRENCVNEMVDRLAASHFLAVLGASGSGKSSLVRTGLLDALELGLYAAAGPEWVIADCHPGSTAIRNLATALLMATGGGATSIATDTLETFLRRGPRAIAEWANDGNLSPANNLLIIVDQFEELFRYGDYAGREEAEAFSTLLLESVRAHRRIHVVITMRSEYLGACSLIPGLAEQINASMYLTRRMTREECREAIEGPAGVIGFDIEPGLVTRLLNDLSALAPWETDREYSQLQRLSRQADQLPLMQHALSRLWQLAQRRPQHGRVVLTLQDYLDIGQLAGALDQHASEVTMQLSEAAQSAVRLVFRSLVSGTSIADAVRKPMRFADLRHAAGADSVAVREVVDAFRAHDCNFLRPGQEVPLADDTIVDISHESLIRQWERLAEWFQEEARSSALWSRLLSDQERYAAGQGELLRGLALANALAWWESEGPTEGWALAHGGKFAEIESYLRASREADERQEQQELQRLARDRRRLRIRAAIYASLAVVSLGLAGWASFQWRESIKARTQLLASNKELDNAQRVAQQQRDSAREALAGKEAADERALAATDRFVVGMARRLLVTPGISTEEVETQLSEGRKYLDEFASHTAQKRQVALIQAKYNLMTAQIYQDRGEFERSIESATEMRQFLISNLGTASLSLEERVQLLEAGNIIAQDLNNLKKFPESLAEAKRLVAEADEMPAGPEVQLEKGKVYISLAIALWVAGDYQNSHSRGDAALTFLRQPGLAETPEVREYQARCYTILAVADWNLGKTQEAEAEEVQSEQAFSAIPLDMKTVPMLLEHSRALSNLAFTRSNHKDLQGARELYERSERILTGSELDIRQRIALRRALVDRRNSLGALYEQLGDSVASSEWYQKAIDVGLMDAKWRQDPELASNLDTALSNQINLLSSDWDTNKDRVVQYERAVRNRLTVLHWLVTNNLLSAPCMGCELDLKRLRMFALTQFDPKLGVDRYADSLAEADEVVAGAKAVLASPDSERLAALTRFIWFKTVQNLGSDPSSFPSARTPEAQLARLNDTRERQRDFLATFPQTWRIERLLGQTEGNRAKLLADLGEKREAIAAAEAGAAAFDKASVELLEDWYRTGSGPAVRDLAKADGYRKLLTSRIWGTDTFTVTATRAWVDGDEAAKYELVAEDQLRPDDDVVSRIVSQYRNIEGMELSKAAQEIMRTSLERTQQRHSRFLDQLRLDGGNFALTRAELTENLRRLLAAHDSARIADEIFDKWDNDRGPQMVRNAIGQLLEDRPGSEYVPDFYKAASKLADNENYECAEGVLTALLERKDLPADLMAATLGLRGEVRQKLKKFDLAEADLSLALVLKPDDAQNLNSEAYVWAMQDQHLPAAVKLLERAVQLAPGDPEIRDSLGWAYVKVGDTEKGLSLVKSASEEQPAEAEIFVHLADIYRRLAQTPEAQVALTHAAILPMDEDVKALYQRVGKLLEEGSGQPALSEDTMLAMLARIMATTDKSARASYSTDDVGIAVRGYDVVSYFEKGAPEQGSIRFAALWNNALWLFSSEDHRAAFKDSPNKYIPVYDGFCPVNYADSQKIHGDPVIWALWNKKLLLFFDEASRTEWMEHGDQLAKKGDAAYEAIRNTVVPGDKESEYSSRIALLERQAAK